MRCVGGGRHNLKLFVTLEIKQKLCFKNVFLFDRKNLSTLTFLSTTKTFVHHLSQNNASIIIYFQSVPPTPLVVSAQLGAVERSSFVFVPVAALDEQWPSRRLSAPWEKYARRVALLLQLYQPPQVGLHSRLPACVIIEKTVIGCA
jgi:hypothetical protein